MANMEPNGAAAAAAAIGPARTTLARVPERLRISENIYISRRTRGYYVTAPDRYMPSADDDGDDDHDDEDDDYDDDEDDVEDDENDGQSLW